MNRNPDNLAYVGLGLGVGALAWGFHSQPFFQWGMAGSAVLLVQAVREPGDRRTLILLAAVLPLSLAVTFLLLPLITRLTPHTLDAQIGLAEHYVSRDLCNWANARPWLVAVLSPFYNAADLALALAVAGMTATKRRLFVVAAVLSSALALPCYVLFPACGPAYATIPDAARNCIPSMHLSAALLMWWFSDGWKRWAALAFVVVTCCTTVMSGQHYVVDLAVAVPFVALTVTAAEWSAYPSRSWRSFHSS